MPDTPFSSLNPENGEAHKPWYCRSYFSPLIVVSTVLVFILAFVVPLGVVASRKCNDSSSSSSTTPYLYEDKAIESSSVGTITRFNSQFDNLVDPSATIESLDLSGFNYGWLEGALWKESTASLLFSDVSANNAIYEWNNMTGVKLVTSPAGFTGSTYDSVFNGPYPGPNGQIFDQDGNHVVCQMGNGAVSIRNAQNSWTPIASTYNGNQFWAPNDIVQDSQGWYWFTDPNFRSTNPSSGKVSTTSVYAARNGTVVKMIDVPNNNGVGGPNGIAFSPSENVLYTTHADGNAYKNIIDRSGAVPVALTTQIFFNTTYYQNNMGWYGHGDGMKVDSEGYVYMSLPGGLIVTDPQGTLLARVQPNLVAQSVVTNIWIAATPKPYLYFVGNMPPKAYRLALKRSVACRIVADTTKWFRMMCRNKSASIQRMRFNIGLECGSEGGKNAYSCNYAHARPLFPQHSSIDDSKRSCTIHKVLSFAIVDQSTALIEANSSNAAKQRQNDEESACKFGQADLRSGIGFRIGCFFVRLSMLLDDLRFKFDNDMFACCHRTLRTFYKK
eukprot:jgi/Bigna1/82507/fgenesh1_pg.93_\